MQVCIFSYISGHNADLSFNDVLFEQSRYSKCGVHNNSNKSKYPILKSDQMKAK